MRLSADFSAEKRSRGFEFRAFRAPLESANRGVGNRVLGRSFDVTSFSWMSRVVVKRSVAMVVVGEPPCG